MCLDGCARDNCFEKFCCFKCSCSLSPCCEKCCSWCGCWTWCLRCCPCCCWPPRQCMAWFLGLFGFLFMLFVLSSPDWIVIEGSGGGDNIRLKDAPQLTIEKASWGLWSGCLLAGEDWTCSPQVETPTQPKMEYDYDTRIIPAWFNTVGLVMGIGEVVLLVALIVVFIGLCAACISCGATARGKIFRVGMYLFLAADFLFFICLLYFPLRLRVFNAGQPVAMTITGIFGWGWGVVILVFVGALLLLLDKEVAGKNDKPAEIEKLL